MSRLRHQLPDRNHAKSPDRHECRQYDDACHPVCWRYFHGGLCLQYLGHGQRYLHGQRSEQSPERFVLECHWFVPLRLPPYGHQRHHRYLGLDQWHDHFLVGSLRHDHEPPRCLDHGHGNADRKQCDGDHASGQHRHLRYGHRLGPGYLSLQWRWLSFGFG